MNDTEITRPPSPTSPLFREREWDKLLTMIGEKRVIPVIGPELLCVRWEEKPAVRLYDLWGQALARQRGIDAAYLAEETPLLYRITNQLSVSPDIPLGDLECDVNDVVRDPVWPLPKSLRQLAEIRDFPLYVTTTIDHLLEAALGEVREAREEVLSIIFKRRGDKAGNDLPRNFVPGRQPTVFHLFGATCVDPDGFAATEDALIEFSWALLDDYAPKRLYDFLYRKTLLLLGCDFPDWLARFLIHALTQRHNAQIELIFVSECRQSGLRDFLRRKRASLPPPQSPVNFVAELHRRWQARPPLERRNDAKVGAVFISYARENQAAAMAIRAQLEQAGIDTWMDESGLEPGVEFQHVIRDNLSRVSFFLAIISRALDLDATHRPGRFVLREWKWAEKVSEERRRDDCFLQPLVVDDTPSGAEFIDRPFRDLHWTRLQDGKLPQEFLDFLKRGIRRYRSNSPGGSR